MHAMRLNRKQLIDVSCSVLKFHRNEHYLTAVLKLTEDYFSFF